MSVHKSVHLYLYWVVQKSKPPYFINFDPNFVLSRAHSVAYLQYGDRQKAHRTPKRVATLPCKYKCSKADNSISAYTVATSCCINDVSLSIEKGDFRSPELENLQTGLKLNLARYRRVSSVVWSLITTTLLQICC